MKLKDFLKEMNICTPQDLAERRQLLLKAADAAEQAHAADILELVCRRWGNLPENLNMDLWESAGEDNDDRNRITITVITEDEGLALKAVKVFAGRDFNKGVREVMPTTVRGDPAFMWEPGAIWPSSFRKVMDAVAEMVGPYQNTRITIAQIRNWVKRVRKSTERLFK